LLRKRFRKLMANSKGFSSVIGTTFMVLVMIFLGTSVFLWTLSQNTLYNEAVRTGSQEEADRRNEGVVTLGGNYSVSGDDVTVLVVLKNAGSVTAQLINLWVLDTNQSKYDNKPLNLNLRPGDIEPDTFTVTIPGANANNTFVSWFVTARGNTVPLEKELEAGVIVAQVAQGIGYLAMDFDKFKYYEYASDYGLKDFPTGSGGYSVPTAEQVVFGVKLTNYDPSGGKRSLTLNSHSLIWMYFPTIGKQVNWHIVNVDANGTIQPTYSAITLAYQETTTVYFASKIDGSFSGTNDKVKPGSGGPAAINLLLLGTIGSDEYGQNIPFVSVYCS
jgi:archaellum component FlaF (FlaF/FlaG flagellin family)